MTEEFDYSFTQVFVHNAGEIPKDAWKVIKDTTWTRVWEYHIPNTPFSIRRVAVKKRKPLWRRVLGF